MKTLTNYIKESFEENTYWKIDRYFHKNTQERKDFLYLIDYFKAHGGLSKQSLEEYLSKHPFNHLKQFIDFIDDNVKSNQEGIDYIYIFYLIVKKLITDKVHQDYLNKDYIQ